MGRDLMTKLEIGLKMDHQGIQVSLNLLSALEKERIYPIVWTKEGNRGGLKISPIQIELNYVSSLSSSLSSLRVQDC